MTTIAAADTPLVQSTLRLADNALVLGHRLSEWCGHAPMLEEDIALANIALDLIGQARWLYAHAAEVEGDGRDEDALAYLRDAADFRNLLLVEQPNGDFALTIARQFLYAALMAPFWRALATSRDETLAAIAAKAEKEAAYHLRHAAEWLIRLGDGTEESHARAQAALDALWPYTGEMFEVDAIERGLVERGVAVDPQALRPEWDETVDQVLAEATLARPPDGWMQSGGRPGATPSISATCSPICSSCSAPIRERRGERCAGRSPIAFDESASLRSRRGASRARLGRRRSVVDPEVPVLTIADLGVLRDVASPRTAVEVTITPTYSGCPAMTSSRSRSRPRWSAPASPMRG